VWGQTTPHFPLYLVEALLVEAVFARYKGRSPVATGAIAGVLIGTVGLAAEWGWSHLWMPIPWESTLLPEAAIAGFITAVAAGAVGGFVGGALARPMVDTSGTGLSRAERGVRMGRISHRAAAAAFLVLVAVVAWGLPVSSDAPDRARVTLTDVQPRPEREVDATVRIEPADAADGAHFLNVTAWQGGGSVVSELERTGPGTYRTTEPIPVYDGWKALVRLHKDDALVGVPIYLPKDEAIPAPLVPAEPRFARSFVREIEILQRERKDDVPGALSLIAYLVVAAIAAGLVVLIAWTLLRLEGVDTGPRRPGTFRRESRTPAGERELV
jgi:hypothetical protein